MMKKLTAKRPTPPRVHPRMTSMSFTIVVVDVFFCEKKMDLD